MSDCPSWQISSWFWQVPPVCVWGGCWLCHVPAEAAHLTQLTEGTCFSGDTSVLSDILSLPIATSGSLSGGKATSGLYQILLLLFWAEVDSDRAEGRLILGLSSVVKVLYWLPACEPTEETREIHHWGVHCLQVISEHSNFGLFLRMCTVDLHQIRPPKKTKTRLTFYMILWRENLPYLNSNAAYINVC